MSKQNIFLFIPILLFFYSCNDIHDFEKERTYPKDSQISHLLILNEGLMNNNNSTLAKYDFSTTKKTERFQPYYFQTVNKRGLGDTANDIQRYGGKIYIVVNVSSQIEVIDAKTGYSIKRIAIFNKKGVARQPRNIAFFKDKAYLCSFDGTLTKIDTTSLTVEATTKVGQNPDGICIANNKIYISNSGGLNYPNYDNTISVVDIATFQEIKKIKVGINPYTVQSDSQDNIYVISRGDYNDIKSSLYKIDSKKDEVTTHFNTISISDFTLFRDTIYFYFSDFKSNKVVFKSFDCIKEKIINQNLIQNKNITITTPYGITINPINNDIYLLDAKNYINSGDVLCFDKKGNFKFRLNEVGLNPHSILFFR